MSGSGMHAARNPVCRALFPGLIGLLCFAPICAFAAEGRLVEERIHSPAIEGNLLGDSPDRYLTVYLPPGYDDDTDRRYPVLYLLHGMLATNTVWTSGQYYGVRIHTMADDLIARGEIEPVIIAMPDANNRYDGSFYANSLLTGNWEYFAVQEVVAHVDRTYRTLPQAASRGIAGHSMGGYGAMQLALLYPDIFCAVDAMSGLPSLDELVFGTVFGAPRGANESALGAAFSPNLGNPPRFMDSPTEFVDGELRPVDAPVRERQGGVRGRCEHAGVLVPPR